MVQKVIVKVKNGKIYIRDAHIKSEYFRKIPKDAIISFVIFAEANIYNSEFGKPCGDIDLSVLKNLSVNKISCTMEQFYKLEEVRCKAKKYCINIIDNIRDLNVLNALYNTPIQVLKLAHIPKANFGTFRNKNICYFSIDGPLEYTNMVLRNCKKLHVLQWTTLEIRKNIMQICCNNQSIIEKLVVIHIGEIDEITRNTIQFSPSLKKVKFRSITFGKTNFGLIVTNNPVEITYVYN